MLRKVGVLLGGLAQDVTDLPQLQLAVLAGVRLVKQLLGVAERTLLQQRSSSQVPFLKGHGARKIIPGSAWSNGSWE